MYATINQANGMVSFHEDPEKYDTNRMLNHIDSQVWRVLVPACSSKFSLSAHVCVAQIKRVAELTGRMRRLDQAIALTPQYVQRTTAHERHSRFGVGLDSDMDQMELDQRPGKGATAIPRAFTVFNCDL